MATGDLSVCTIVENDMIVAIEAQDTADQIKLVKHFPGTTDQMRPGHVTDQLTQFEDTACYVAYDQESGQFLNVFEDESVLVFSIIMLRKTEKGDGEVARIGTSSVIGLNGMRDIVRDAFIVGLTPGGGHRIVDQVAPGTDHKFSHYTWRGVTMSWTETRAGAAVAIAHVTIKELSPN